MLYNIAPSPTLGLNEHEFVTWNDGFTKEEINEVIKIGDALEKEHSKVDKGILSPKEIRISEIAWMHPTENTIWIYDKLSWILRQLNAQFYRFNITGFNEPLQYTTYNGIEKDGGHYSWHRDTGVDVPRKLSMIMQLSDPNEYEGGDLELLNGNGNILKVDKKKGFIAMFPSYHAHRVTPVTSGFRRSLVVWASGPAFV
jgi:PKHD-type hydroxylase